VGDTRRELMFHPKVLSRFLICQTDWYRPALEKVTSQRFFTDTISVVFFGLQNMGGTWQVANVKFDISLISALQL
jgi:hypothetical protein